MSRCRNASDKEWFSIRNNMNFRLFSGEEAAVDTERAEDWKSKPQNMFSECPPENQFSENEAVLFY
jgi:hypothetical protein